VASLIKLLKEKESNKPPARAELADIEKELAEKIKDNETAKKVKNFRDNKLGHKNKELILKARLEKEFLENNKLDIDDLEALLHLLSNAIKRASERARFHVLTLPETSIRAEISDLFDLLSEKQSQPFISN
jgi:hypothetical protein